VDAKQTGIVLAIGGGLLLLYFLFSGKLPNVSPTLGLTGPRTTSIIPGTAVGLGNNYRGASLGYPGTITPQGPAAFPGISGASGYGGVLGGLFKAFGGGIPAPSPATDATLNAAALSSPATKAWACSGLAEIEASQNMLSPTGMQYGPAAPPSSVPSPSILTTNDPNAASDTLLSSISCNAVPAFPGAQIQGGGNCYVAPVAAMATCVGFVGSQCLSTVCA
jgi:hypothetical protein